MGAVLSYAGRPALARTTAHARAAFYRRYMTAAGADHPGDQLLYSAVLGYRPPIFRRELPRSDWRIFIEGIGEATARDRQDGAGVINSGGHQIFLAPTVLGLFGAWGISGGPAFRVYGNVNGLQQQDRLRLVTYWF